MTKLSVFLGILTAFVLILLLGFYKDLPVNKAAFNLEKTEKNFIEHKNLIAEVTAPKETKEEVEVEVKEYAPIVELNTPELVAGQKLYNQCIACHGKGGEGKTSQKAPHIGGQYDWYVEKQLVDMKSGDRINAPMAPIVKGLSPEDMKNVAQYVSKLPWNKEKYLEELSKAEKK